MATIGSSPFPSLCPAWLSFPKKTAAEKDFAYKSSGSGSNTSNSSTENTTAGDTSSDSAETDSVTNVPDADSTIEIADEETPLHGWADSTAPDGNAQISETTGIADEKTPQAETISEASDVNHADIAAKTETAMNNAAAVENAEVTAETVEDEAVTDIADQDVPLAAASENEQSAKNSIGIAGMVSAALAALLLLFKRKKDNEEEQA